LWRRERRIILGIVAGFSPLKATIGMKKKNYLFAMLITALVEGGFAETLPDTMLAGMWSFTVARLKAAMADLGNATSQFPRRAPQTGGAWQTEGPSSWISGFYPGCLWLAFEKTGDTAFRAAAQRWTAALSGQSSNTGTHDVGFMIYCSFGNGYRLLSTPSYKSTIHAAAQSLSTRFRPRAGIIDSWSFSPFTDENGWEEIIDNMMNLELLFWSARNGGDPRCDTIARSHAEKAMNNHFRPDSSTFHVVRYSTATGSVIGRETRQGYANSSCWARGQAWAAYGFTMAYRYTGDARFLATARKAADYFLRRLPADRVPYWDFDAPGIPSDTVPRDASSSAIVASALFELSRFSGAPDSGRYFDCAVSLVQALWTLKYRGRSTQASILNHSTGSRMEGHDVDMGIIYADYYFLEALLRYEKYARASTSAGSGVCKPGAGQKRPAAVRANDVDVLGRLLPQSRVRTAPAGAVKRTGLKSFGCSSKL
jgi:unsaturated chondroitin disaccharide hydrolase